MSLQLEPVLGILSYNENKNKNLPIKRYIADDIKIRFSVVMLALEIRSYISIFFKNLCFQTLATDDRNAEKMKRPDIMSIFQWKKHLYLLPAKLFILTLIKKNTLILNGKFKFSVRVGINIPKIGINKAVFPLFQPKIL